MTDNRSKLADPARDRWDRPWPYGFARSIEAAGTTAAPVLAGFSLALVVLVVQEEKSLRAADEALVALVFGALCLIGAVQAAFWARQYEVTPAEIEEWHPDADLERQREIQRLHRQGARIWTGRFNRLYRWGILALLVGVALVLVPKGDASDIRTAAVVLAALGALLEWLWIFSLWVLADEPDWAVENDSGLAMARRRQRRRDRLRRRMAGIPAVHGMARLFTPRVRVTSPEPMSPDPAPGRVSPKS